MFRENIANKLRVRVTTLIQRFIYAKVNFRVDFSAAFLLWNLNRLWGKDIHQLSNIEMNVNRSKLGERISPHAKLALTTIRSSCLDKYIKYNRRLFHPGNGVNI